MPRMSPLTIGVLIVLAILALNSLRMQQSDRMASGFKSLNMRMATGGAAPPAAGMDAMYAPEAAMYEQGASGAPGMRDDMSGMVTASPASSGGSGSGSLEEMQGAETDRYLIRNGTLVLEVQDPSATARQVEQLAETNDGYTGELRESVDSLNRKTATLTIRVPADKFERVFGDLANLGKPLDRWITTDDVTEEFLDVQRRIANLKDTEARLLSHLQDSRKLSDTLEIEREITRIRGELEGYEGRMKYLAHRISFSTINLTLQEEAGPEPLTPPSKFSIQREFSAAVRDLVTFGQGIVAQVVWIGVWSVVWLPMLLVALWLWRRMRAPRRVERGIVESVT